MFVQLIILYFKQFITLMLYYAKKLRDVLWTSSGKQILTINDLNDDVLLSALDYLTVSELWQCRAVCVRWRTLVTRELRKQKTITLTRMFGIPFDDCCDDNQKLSLCHKNRSIIVLKHNISHNSLLSGIIGECVNLKSINLVGVHFSATYSPIKFLTDHCYADLIHCNLAHIYNKELSNNRGDARILITREEMIEFVAKFPNIVHFNAYRSWIKFTESSLAVLLNKLEKLEFIAFAKESQCVSDDFDDIIDGHYLQHINPNVKTIRITKNILGTNGLFYLSERLRNLRQLKVNIIDSIEQLRIICNSFAETLKCVSFELCVPVEHKTEAFRLLAKLTELEEIDIAMNDENEATDDSCFLILVRHTPHLKSVIFRIRLTNISIKYFHIYWPRLEKLRIKPKHGSIINSESVESIVKLKNLKYLDLTESELGDEHVSAIVHSLNSLRHLNLTATRITIRSLELFAQRAELNPRETYVVMLRRTQIVMSEIKSVVHIPTNLLTQ